MRCDSMFRGYWNDEEATRATLRAGWCHTGDIGRFDDRGLLYLVHRKKDVIITGGENVYSPEVEDVISSLDAVVACAVVGTPDRRWGETVCAVVVQREGARVTLGDLQECVRRTLAGFKVPRRLEIVAALPLWPAERLTRSCFARSCRAIHNTIIVYLIRPKVELLSLIIHRFRGLRAPISCLMRTDVISGYCWRWRFPPSLNVLPWCRAASAGRRSGSVTLPKADRV